MALQRTKEPGVFFDDVLNKTIKIVEWRVDDRYDTIVTASGAVTAGTQKKFFNDLTNKDKIDANFPTTLRVCGAGEEMIIERIGIYVPQALGNTLIPPQDIKKATDNLHVLLKINRDDVAEGPALRFPSGYGLIGSTTENNSGVVTNGVASPSAVGRLARPHEVGMHTEVAGLATWFDHVWDATNLPTFVGKVYHRLHLSGLLKVAATRAG